MGRATDSYFDNSGRWLRAMIQSDGLERWLLRSSGMWLCVAGFRRLERTTCHHLEMPIKPWLWNRPLKMTALISFETSGTTKPATQRDGWEDPKVSLTPLWWPHVTIFISTHGPYRLFKIPSLLSVGCPRVSGVETTKRWSDLSPSYSGVHRHSPILVYGVVLTSINKKGNSLFYQ